MLDQEGRAAVQSENARHLVLAATMMATFMAAVEGTIIATAMPTIVGDLGDFHLFSWVFAVYLLTQAVSIPVYGRLADLYGRKPMFFIGASLFLIGSILCGFARGMLSLIAFRGALIHAAIGPKPPVKVGQSISALPPKFRRHVALDAAF